MILKHLNDELIAQNIQQLQRRLCFPNCCDKHFENRWLIPFPTGDFSGDSIEKEIQNLAVWIREKIITEFDTIKTVPGKIFAFGFLNYRIDPERMVREFSISYTFDFNLRPEFNLDLSPYDEPELKLFDIDKYMGNLQQLVFSKWEDKIFENVFTVELPNNLHITDQDYKIGVRRLAFFLRKKIDKEFYGKNVKFGKLSLGFTDFDGRQLQDIGIPYEIASNRKTTRDKIMTNLRRNGTVFPYPVIK